MRLFHKRSPIGSLALGTCSAVAKDHVSAKNLCRKHSKHPATYQLSRSPSCLLHALSVAFQSTPMICQEETLDHAITARACYFPILSTYHTSCLKFIAITTSRELSVVSRYHHRATWTPPSGSLEHWDQTDVDCLELPVMTQLPDHSRHGFVLHDNCRRLLQRTSTSSPISVSRLLRSCECFPLPLATNTVFWGHDFGGLWI